MRTPSATTNTASDLDLDDQLELLVAREIRTPTAATLSTSAHASERARVAALEVSGFALGERSEDCRADGCSGE